MQLPLPEFQRARIRRQGQGMPCKRDPGGGIHEGCGSTDPLDGGAHQFRSSREQAPSPGFHSDRVLVIGGGDTVLDGGTIQEYTSPFRSA